MEPWGARCNSIGKRNQREMGIVLSAVQLRLGQGKHYTGWVFGVVGNILRPLLVMVLAADPGTVSPIENLLIQTLGLRQGLRTKFPGQNL